MLGVIRDGILVLYNYREAILFFFVTICGLGIYSIKQTIYRELEGGIKLAAILGIGSIILCVYSYILIFLSHFWLFLLLPGSYAILFFAVFVLLKGLWSGDIKVSVNISILI